MGEQETAHERIRIVDEMQHERKLLVGDAAHLVRGFKQLRLDDDQRGQRAAAVGENLAAALIADRRRPRTGDFAPHLPTAGIHARI